MSENTRQVGVSNTEVQQAYKCELSWLYGFHPGYNYQSRDMGPARTRGILGHSALEVFYKDLKEEVDYDTAASNALEVIQELRIKEMMAGDFMNPERMKMLNYLYDILTRYFEHYKSDIRDWEILDVEGFHSMEWDGERDFYLPSRLDVTIWHKRGQFRGETSPVDHKFVYDFWQQTKFRINSQFPLYILALRAARFAGKPEPVVKRAIINEIRTRELKNPEPEELFRRTEFPYSTSKVENVFNNHLRSAVHLAYLKRMPVEEAREEVRAAIGSEACKFCDFKDLCDIELEGGDPSNVIAATLKKNEYGYPALEEIRRERT